MSFSNTPQPISPLQRYMPTLLVMLILLACAERIYGIDRQSLWSDELFAITASFKPTWTSLWSLLVGDSHPPGYVLFMYWTLPLSGYSDIGIRLHALLFGVLWIPLVYWVGKRWFGDWAALFAAAILVSGYNAIYYSQEARAYTMLVAFNLINIGCFFEILFGKSSQRRHISGFILSTLAMLYLHYAGFVFLSAEILLYAILWFLQQRKGSVLEAAKIFGIPLLLYLPWLGIMYHHMVNAPQDWSVSAAPTLSEGLNTLHRLVGPDNSHALFVALTLSAAFLYALIDRVKNGMSRALLAVYSLFFLMIVPILAFYIESALATPIFEKRYFLNALPIAALLIGYVANAVLSRLSAVWKVPACILAMLIFTVWTIDANSRAGLYTKLDKDPVREAVTVIKNDVEKNAMLGNYTVIMTHDWFENYLKRSGISYDDQWEFRRFYVPQQVMNVDDYLLKHKNIDYFYYLSLRQPNSESATFALRQQYKLLSKAEVSIEAGTLDVFKFSAKEFPDAADLQGIGTNRSNEIAKLVAQDIGDKPPEKYIVLITHDWMKPYLRRNGVHYDESEIGTYIINAQARSVLSYVKNHPDIDTLYYLALDEPNVEGAILMLQYRYLLEDEKTVKTSVGNVNILKFNVKAPPVVTASIRQRLQASQTNRVAEWILADTAQAQKESYAVAYSHTWLEPYLKLNGINYDETWVDRQYYINTQAPSVYSYIDQHAAVSELYYVALRTPETERAALMLQLQYREISRVAFEVSAGVVDVIKFNTKVGPVDTIELKKRLAGSPLYEVTHLAVTDAKSAGKNASAFMVTHDWLRMYLRYLGAELDGKWNGDFYYAASQLDEVSRHLQMHPEINRLYYLALMEPGLQPAVDALKGKLAITCEKFIDGPVGRLALMRFDTKAPPKDNSVPVPTCQE